MKEEPQPAKWMGWTVLFTVLTVASSGSWWQLLPLFLLAGSGGTWAVENELWQQLKRQKRQLQADEDYLSGPWPYSANPATGERDPYPPVSSKGENGALS